MDVEVTVKYTLRNFCDKDDLKDKTLSELFKEVVYDEENIRLFSNKSEIKSIKIKED